MSFNPTLHALRGVAAMAVLMFHWYQFFPITIEALSPDATARTLLDPTIYLAFGWLGVPLFFVLSGYLLGAQVIESRLSAEFLRKFWLRRLVRIYPAVWAELIILLLLSTVIAGLISDKGMETLPLQFMLWVNLPPVMATPINLVWWTLPVELSFYALLPLLGLLVRYMGWRLLLCVAIAVTLGWRVWLFATTETNNYLSILPVLDSLPGVLLTFMLGFSINFLPADLPMRQRRVGLAVALVLLLTLMQWQLIMGDVYWTGHWILVVWPPCVACCIAALVYFFRDPTPEWGWLNHGALVWLGHVSFGIYLWHFQVFRVLTLVYPDAWTTPLSGFGALLIAVPATLGLAALSFYVVERPLMTWARRVT
ncbi:MAG: acyltransferase [Luminiphilus sp.]